MIRTSSFSQKRFQKLESFRKPLLKQSSLPMLLTDQAAIKIQRFYRGYRGRKLFRDRSVFSFRQRYQKQFETLEGLQRFKFQQFGAAIVIQRWFRSWKSVRKSIWHKKHHLMKLKYMHHKVLLRAIFKSRSIPFTQPDLDNTTKLRHAAAIVAQRVIRGFLGRRRFKAYKLHVADTKMLRNRTAVLIQSIARMYIAQVHYFPLAYRYRLFTRKVRKAVAPAKASLDNSDAFYPEDFATTRRQSFLFLTLKIAGAQDLDRFELAATVIQSHIRRILALVVYREQLHARKEVLATRLQKWVVKRLWKRKFSRAMKQIRPFLKGIVESKRKKHDAAVKMQSLMRGFVKRKWLKYLLSTRKRCSAQIGRWLFYRFKVWKIHQAIYIRRLQSDLYQGGLSMYERTRTYWYSHFLWLGIKKTKQIEKLDHELQRIFSSMSLSNGVEIPKVFKLLRDCKGLISGAFTATTIELQFTKMKVGIERRVEYPRFLDFLANLAVVRFLDFDPPKTIFEDIAAFKQQPAPPNPAAVAATMAGNIAQTSLAKGAPPPPVDDKMMAVMGYQFGSLRGRPALIAHFVHQYIGTLPEYERAMEYLGKKSARELAEAVIAQAIATIQGFVRNRAFIRQTIDDMRRRKQAKIDHKIYVAAARIQSVVKGFLGRRLITRMAQTLYSKYVDGETEREYWFNPRTNNSFWVKPKLLGKYDCGTAIRMPKEDELFSVMCSNCEVVHGTCFCETCDHPYCTPCFATLHRTGTRKTHLHILIDNCVQCEFQIGTRYCNTCKDLFCDSCYQYMHRAGRLRFHAFERFAAPCDVCNKRTARWKEHGHVTLNSSEVSVRSKIHRQGTSSLSSAASSKNTSIQSMYNSRYKIKLWCTVCYKVEHEGEAPVERKADAQTHTLALEKIYYYGRAVKKHIENKEIEKAQALIEKSFQARKAVVEMKLRTKAALNIQRVYRGYQGRKKIHAFIQERKELMAKRHIEDAIRQSVLYKLKSFFGFSIMLETDTPLERVKKMYPWYMHHIVAACIENNWTDACRLLTEHEKHLAKTSATKKATWMDYVKAEIAVYYARKRYDKALRQFEERSALVDTAASTFYNAEASGAYGEAKLKKLKSGMNKLEKELQKDIFKKQKAEDALDDAEQRVIDILGPRGLQILVEERRRTGVPMPFRLKLKKDSSLALVQYPVAGRADGGFGPSGRRSRLRASSLFDAQEGLDGASVEENDPTHASPDHLAEDHDPSSAAFNVTLDQYVVGQNIPGQWKSRLKVGERIYIDQILFTIAPPIVAKKKRRHSSSKSSRGSSRGGSRGTTPRDGSDNDSTSSHSRKKSGKEYSAVDTDDALDSADNSGVDYSSARKFPRKTALDSVNSFSGNDDASSNAGSADHSMSDVDPSSRRSKRSARSSADTPGSGAEDGETEAEEITEDHIQLDRPWLLDDVEYMEVYKLVPSIFYMKPVYALRRKLIRSYFTQKAVAIMAINNHKLSNLYASLSGMFDDESESFARFQRWSLRAMERKNAWLRLSYRKVDMSYDFALRKKCGQAVWKIVQGLGSGLKMLSNVAKVVNSGAEETPYEYWQRSYEKEKIAVTLDLGNDQVISLGDIEMDLKAPCEIMREYIHRAFREKLNETIGESFLFAVVDEESNKTTILPREDEYKTYSKVFAVPRVDPRTFVSSIAILLMKDKMRGRVFIPEFVDKHPEEEKEKEAEEDDED